MQHSNWDRDIYCRWGFHCTESCKAVAAEHRASLTCAQYLLKFYAFYWNLWVPLCFKFAHLGTTRPLLSFDGYQRQLLKLIVLHVGQGSSPLLLHSLKPSRTHFLMVRLLLLMFFPKSPRMKTNFGRMCSMILLCCLVINIHTETKPLYGSLLAGWFHQLRKNPGWNGRIPFRAHYCVRITHKESIRIKLAGMMSKATLQLSCELIYSFPKIIDPCTFWLKTAESTEFFS